MFDVIFTCKIEDLYHYVEQITEGLTSEREAEEFIRALFKSIPELTESQEKKLHRLGRKVRKRFGMKPVKMNLERMEIYETEIREEYGALPSDAETRIPRTIL